MPDLDLPALRAVIAGVRERLDEFSAACQEVGSHRTPEAIGRAKGVRGAVESDLTLLASACERLAEENERLRGEVAALALPDGCSLVVCANELVAQMMDRWSAPVQLKMLSLGAGRLTFAARNITPAPAVKAGDMSTGLTIDSSAPAGKGEG